MHEQDMAILRGLVPVAWADGTFAEREKEMLLALLDAYAATDEEKQAVWAFASTHRSLADIDLSALSADDRRVLLQHAVLLSFVDGAQSREELALLQTLGEHLRIPDPEASKILEIGAERAKRFLHLL